MRFCDSFHKRIHRVSKFNSTIKTDKNGKKVECSQIKLPNYIIYSIEFPDRFGYIVEKPSALSSVLKKMAQKEPEQFNSNDVDYNRYIWYIEFEVLEKSLNPVLEEVENHEKKLMELANEVSKRI